MLKAEAYLKVGFCFIKTHVFLKKEDLGVFNSIYFLKDE